MNPSNPSLTEVLFQAPQSERPSDSEANTEGAVRSQSGSFGEEEQSVLQVVSWDSRTTVLVSVQFCFVFHNSNSNTKFNENKFSIPFRRQRICESSTAFVIIVSFSGKDT